MNLNFLEIIMHAMEKRKKSKLVDSHLKQIAKFPTF